MVLSWENSGIKKHTKFQYKKQTYDYNTISNIVKQYHDVMEKWRDRKYQVNLKKTTKIQIIL